MRARDFCLCLPEVGGEQCSVIKVAVLTFLLITQRWPCWGVGRVSLRGEGC